MAKSSAETMKKDEMKVLNALRTHAKENANELGKRCGFSPQKVARIIKNLENQKRIWGYATIDDGEANGYKHFFLLLKRSMLPLDDSMQKEVTMEKLEEYLPNGVIIHDIFITHGRHNAVLTFYAPNLVTAKRVVNELMALHGKYKKYFDESLLLETLFPIRKQGFKNPQIKNLVNYI